jgi:hypothetical protein
MSDEPQTPLSPEDLLGWARKAYDHLQKHCPNLVRELDEAGILLQECQEAGRNADNYYDQLIKHGFNTFEATSIAEREFIVIPDVDPAADSEDDDAQ